MNILIACALILAFLWLASLAVIAWCFLTADDEEKYYWPD